MSFALPFEKVFTLRPEVVDMRLEMQFEDVIFMDVFRLAGMCYWVTQQRQTGQRILILTERTVNREHSTHIPHIHRGYHSVCLLAFYLVCFVEEQGEVGENHPEFLPAVAVFKLSEQISWELVLSGTVTELYYTFSHSHL